MITKLSGFSLSESSAKLLQIARVLLVLSVFSMPISTAGTNVLMGLTLIVWLLAGGQAQQLRELRTNRVAMASLGLFALIVAGSLYSTGPLEDIVYQVQKYARLLFILPAMALLNEEEWRERAMQAFIAAMVLTLALSLLSVVVPLSFVKGTAGGPSDNHFVFKDHIAQNLIMSFFVLVMLVKGQAEANPRKRLALLAIALLAIADIVFFVQGRTGYVSLALNILVFIAVAIGNWRQKILWLLSAVLIAAFALQFSPAMKSRIELAVKEFRESDRKELSSVGQRVEFTKKSIQLIKERPLFGFGTGSYATEFCRVAETPEWCEAGRFHPHNQFMALGVQLGVVGILAYLGLMLMMVRQALSYEIAGRTLALGLVATLLADSVLHAPLFLITEAQFFMLLMAISLACNKGLISLAAGTR